MALLLPRCCRISVSPTPRVRPAGPIRWRLCPCSTPTTRSGSASASAKRVIPTVPSPESSPSGATPSRSYRCNWNCPPITRDPLRRAIAAIPSPSPCPLLCTSACCRSLVNSRRASSWCCRRGWRRCSPGSGLGKTSPWVPRSRVAPIKRSSRSSASSSTPLCYAPTRTAILPSPNCSRACATQT